MAIKIAMTTMDVLQESKSFREQLSESGMQEIAKYIEKMYPVNRSDLNKVVAEYHGVNVEVLLSSINYYKIMREYSIISRREIKKKLFATVNLCPNDNSIDMIAGSCLLLHHNIQ